MAASKADILTLAKAGFSAKQIATILNENLKENLDGEPPVPTPVPVPKPEGKSESKNESENNNENAFQLMNQKFDQMIQLMQAQNLMNSQQPKQETIEDIMASIIDPNGGK